MRVIIATQNDRFIIPRNVDKLCRLEWVEVVAIITLTGKADVTTQRKNFFRGFGIIQSLKMAFHLLLNRLFGTMETLLGNLLSFKPRNLESLAKRHKIPYHNLPNINDSTSLSVLEDLKPDVIVSFSAPVIFKEKLLAIPKAGCINLHCSLLPHYAGLLPSFWVLYKRERYTGATVHYMDSKIDNGGILGQTRLPVLESDTMYDIILKTKTAGGDLMIEVLEKLKNGNLTVIPNETEKGSYFTWPTVNEIKAFRSKGGRLI